MKQIHLRSFSRFLLVGGSATLLQYLCMAVLIQTEMARAALASAIGYILSTLYNYWANARFTFNSSVPHTKSFPRFVLMALVGLIINQIVLTALLSASVTVVVAQLAATAVVLLWNYFINATWIFARHSRS